MPNNKKPLYEVIYRQYKTRIISGELVPGTRLPTEKKISADFNVSRITVTRALKDLELGKYIRRIKGSGSYVTDRQWKSGSFTGPEGTANRKSLDFISLILPFEGDFSSEYLKGIEDTAKGEGYFVTLHNSAEDPEHEIEIIEDVLNKGSHGLIIYPASETANLHMYSSLMIQSYPFVLIDRKIPGIDTTLVSADNLKGFEEITSSLIELGHRKIVFVGTSVSTISSEQDRYKGFCQAHINHGISLMKKNMYSFRDAEKIPADYCPQCSREKRMINFFLDLLESLEPAVRPTAVAAVNDLLARLIMTTAIERNISIPGDYSLTGFDNLPYAAHLPVPLTTVEQPAYEIGRLAAGTLFKRLRNRALPQEILTVAPSLIIRDSAAPV